MDTPPNADHEPAPGSPDRPADAQPAVRVRGLRRCFGSTVAVDGIDFDVAAGEVFALLGPNGAGKTTTVEMLEGYIAPDAGSISVLGQDPLEGGSSYRDRIGIVTQHSAIERELTVREALAHIGSWYSKPQPVDGMIERAGLVEKADARIKTLSGGQRRRLDLAAALVGTPELVFLDEPTTGFDPAARREAWDIVRGLTSGGTTVILTTHYLDEAQALADRVAVIRSGVIVAEGDPSTLGGRDMAKAQITFRWQGAHNELPDAGVEPVVDGERVSYATDRPTAVLATLTGWATAGGIELTALEVSRPTLEDVYLHLVGDPS
ncbi:MAG: ABC transporter ATP-binding protein [Acidimicrobiia bacterium]